MAKLSLFVCSGDLIKVGCGWLWVMVVKLWLVIGGGGKIMAGRGWRLQRYACSWVVGVRGGKIMAGRMGGCRWSWIIMDCRGGSTI